jgi:hypothetical protein
MNMNKLTIGVLVALGALLAMPDVPAQADWDGGRIRARLRGFEETPAVSSTASGEFHGKISKDETSVEYQLSYENLEADVRQAHIHFGQGGVAGGISVFLCQTATNPDPTGNAPICPQSGDVTGTFTAANVIGPAGQGIAAGEFAELLRAIRKGVTYANVHTVKFPSGEIRGQIKHRGHDDD